MLNSDWDESNEKKHALYGAICQWLRTIGQAWIQNGVPWGRMCGHFVKKLVGQDMVTINLTESLLLLILVLNTDFESCCPC
jgi:hypothetical protein